MFEPIITYEQFKGSVKGIRLLDGNSLVHYFPKKREPENARCISIQSVDSGHNLTCSYYVGIDWILEKEQAIYVQPKLNLDSPQTDYLAMLVKALKHPGTSQFTDELFEIKLEKPFIEIDHHQDLITPLIVVQFLSVLQSIVRKGLKKSFYKVENNLKGRIKGKILIGQTVKNNLFKNKILNTFCQYEEFGYDSYENRLLKKALIFVQRYLPNLKLAGIDKYALNILDFVMPAFSSVNNDVDINEIKQNKPNIFYKEYSQGIRLAKLILKRFGYNINNTQKSGKIKTPPFWIDMSKLFELYVLGLLKDKYPDQTEFQFKANYGNPDFLLLKEQFVVDAKYKTYYNEDFTGQVQWKRDNIASDIRQVSGYARDKKVLSKLQLSIVDNVTVVPKCLIIYPDQQSGNECFTNLDLSKTLIKEFENFYKLPISLPVIIRKFDLPKIGSIESEIENNLK